MYKISIGIINIHITRPKNLWNKHKLRIRDDGHIIPNAAFHRALLFTEIISKAEWNRNINRDISKRIHSSTGVVLPIGERTFLKYKKNIKENDDYFNETKEF